MDALAAAEISLFEGFRLDRRAGVLFRRDERGVFTPIAIGRRALDILGVLVERPGDLVSRDEIIDAVWPGTTVEDSNLNVQVAALRRILDDRRAESSCIQTVSGRGYRFIGSVTQVVEPAPPAVGAGQPYDPSTGIAAHLGTAPRLSIVVLPFSNLSDDREQQFFADGITEDLTTDLSRLADMLVISRNTAITYGSKPVGTKQIGRELCVRYVLEGSVRRSGDQVRVNAQLIDAETDAHLWAERFDREMGDLFALQDEITSRIAIALNLELVAAEAARATEHPDALDHILRGRAVGFKPMTRDSFAEAITLFERALAVDPGSIEAQIRLAGALVGRLFDFGSSSAEADIERAEELAAKAVAALPHSYLAHHLKGQVLRVQRRCAEAIPEYETTLALYRNSVSALANIGRCKIYVGPIEEAIPALEQAIRLSPRDPDIVWWYFRIGQAHLLQSHTDEATLWLERALRANAGMPGTHAYLAAAYALAGESERAATELAEAQRLRGEGSWSSLARFRADTRYEAPSIRALAEATIFDGLRKAGMPEE
jgi:TolB-like protein/lipopolysaccharide biosynthesis regulator YciM